MVLRPLKGLCLRVVVKSCRDDKEIVCRGFAEEGAFGVCCFFVVTTTVEHAAAQQRMQQYQPSQCNEQCNYNSNNVEMPTNDNRDDGLGCCYHCCTTGSEARLKAICINHNASQTSVQLAEFVQ